MLELIIYIEFHIKDMLVKRPRRNDDLHIYYYLECPVLIIYDIVFLYTLLMFICAFYMVFCAA